jgi:hypothetical protein
MSYDGNCSWTGYTDRIDSKVTQMEEKIAKFEKDTNKEFKRVFIYMLILAAIMTVMAVAL